MTTFKVILESTVGLNFHLLENILGAYLYDSFRTCHVSKIMDSSILLARIY